MTLKVSILSAREAAKGPVAWTGHTYNAVFISTIAHWRTHSERTVVWNQFTRPGAAAHGEPMWPYPCVPCSVFLWGTSAQLWAPGYRISATCIQHKHVLYRAVSTAHIAYSGWKKKIKDHSVCVAQITWLIFTSLCSSEAHNSLS